MSLSESLKSSIVSFHQGKIQDILKLYEDENKVYLKPKLEFEEPVIDLCRLKDDIILLSNKSIMYVFSKQKINIESDHHPQKIISKDENNILIAMESPNDLFLFDLLSKDLQHIKIQGLFKDERVISGLIYNPCKEKLKIWVGSSQGRVLSIGKAYIRNKQEELITLEGRSLEAIHFMCGCFVIVITNSEILVLKQNLIPYQKISQEKSAVYLSQVAADKDRIILIFDQFLLLLQYKDGRLSYTKMEVDSTIIGSDWIPSDKMLMLLCESGRLHAISCLPANIKQEESLIRLNFPNVKLPKSVSMAFLRSETLFLIDKKLFSFSKIENNSDSTSDSDAIIQAEPLNDLEYLKNSPTTRSYTNSTKDSPRPTEITIHDLVISFDNCNLEAKQTMKIVETIFHSNPKLLYPYNEKIIKLYLKAGERNNPIILHLIEKSNTINLEEFLNLMIEYKAYTEAVHFYYKLGSYDEAFQICEKQDNLELMLKTLERCSTDQDYFSPLFLKFINYLKRTSRDIEEDILINFMKRHPNLLECIEVIPTRWMKNPKVIQTILDLFERIRLENRALIKSKQIQVQEIWNQFNGQYSDSNTCRSVNGPTKCKICQNGLFTEGNIKTKPIIQFFSCPHIFHKNCLKIYNLTANKEIACPFCK